MRQIIFVAIFGTTVLIGLAIKESQQPPPVAKNPAPPITAQPPAGPPPQPPALSKDEALQLITAENLKTALHFLASQDLEGRMSGKRGNKRAFAYIEDMYKSFGLKTERDRFAIQRVNPGPHNEQGDDFTENVYAYIEGSDPVLKDEIVVIGAHGDHIGWGSRYSRSRSVAVHPGADDNASGTVCIMAVAEAFAKLGPIPRTIVFQSYSGEEMGLIGSRHYVSNPTFPKNGPAINKHIAMCNLDMVGRLGRGAYAVGWHDGMSSIDLRRYISELSSKYTFARNITGHSSGGSDHAPFYNARVPIAFLHTGTHGDYHTPTDTADKINYTGMEGIAKYCFELAYKIVHADTRPAFNHASFKKMDYIHDHGHKGDPKWIHHYHRHHVREGHNHSHEHEHSHEK